MENKPSSFLLTDDDIRFISEHLANLAANGPINAEVIAQELMASLIVSNIRNGG